MRPAEGTRKNGVYGALTDICLDQPGAARSATAAGSDVRGCYTWPKWPPFPGASMHGCRVFSVHPCVDLAASMHDANGAACDNSCQWRCMHATGARLP